MSNAQMDVILNQRFAPFDFSYISSFPNDVPTMNEWGDILPKFREDEEDNTEQHLVKFHEYMNQLDLHHEDGCMKMFMYSFEGDA